MNPPARLPDRARSHGRAASADERRRVAIPQPSTRGPLDAAIDDPLSPPPPETRTPQRVLSPALPEHDAGAAAGTLALPDMPTKDFSFLQDAAAYHVLPTTNVPAPFLQPSNLPSVASPVDSLLRSGHFRLAAIAAARNIVQAASPTDYPSLFHLLHIRLACLCLISEHALAAHESKVLGDLNSAFYRHPLTNEHFVPWVLRVLTVRLAALGYGEWRKGIMGYYELAQECRDNIARSSTDANDEEKQLWRTRLRDCGVRVANILVEMGDLEGAGQHLSSLSSPDPTTAEAQQILYMETLVWLRIGDTRAANRCLEALSSVSPPSSPSSSSSSSSHSPPPTALLPALLHLATSSYAAATTSFTTLHEEYPTDAMVAQNLAVCLLYTGQISAARKLLSELVETSPPFHSLVFNLCTVFELCTERSRERKEGLAEVLAQRKEGDGAGWEVSSAGFKL